jgi:hypothetical protein
MPYRFQDQLQREIDQFAGDDPGQISQEVSITRWLIQKAVENGQYPLANSLLATLAKLSSVEISNQVRAGRLLELSTVAHIAHLMAAAVAKRLEGLPNFETLADAITADFTEIIQSERKQLTYQPGGDTNGSRD